jgi:outer membrane lipoprotein-sorting protein
MKATATFILALFAAVAALAQTPQEIVARMDDVMKEHEKEGISLVIEVKMPIVGSMVSRSYTLGDKARVEADLMGVAMVTWTDGKSQWVYDSDKNQVEIKDWTVSDKSSTDGDAAMFSGIIEGYEIILKDETDDAWYLLCRKLRSNRDKDAPKSMDLVVAKGSYYPVSLRATVSGITLTMRDIAFGVSESLVTFNPSDYPGVKILDNRK